MLGGYEAQADYYPQWHQPYNYVTQLPYGECIHLIVSTYRLAFLSLSFLLSIGRNYARKIQPA